MSDNGTPEGYKPDYKPRTPPDDHREVVIDADTPRLAVTYKSIDGKDAFAWAVVRGDQIPLMNLISAVISAQLAILTRQAPTLDQEVGMALVWHPEDKGFTLWVHRDIPPDPLVGFLETIKAVLVGSSMAQRAAANQIILGPDGRPFGR